MIAIIVLLLWLQVISDVCGQHYLLFLSAVDADELLTFSVQSYTVLHCVVALLFSLGVTFVRL